MKNQNKRVALKFATFAALFGVMSFFMDMMEENEEQTTYSVTLESLLHAQSETNGEAGGGGSTNGEAGGDPGTTGETGGGTDEGTTGGQSVTVVKCDLCVVKRKEKVKFSCKSYIGSTCSTSKYGHTLSCNNAMEC